MRDGEVPSRAQEAPPPAVGAAGAAPPQPASGAPTVASGANGRPTSALEMLLRLRWCID